MRFDVAVVGLGLIGAAALRHLAAGGVSAIGIGPAEPDDWAASATPFASHYDSGRITRRLDARYEWAVLASRSIDQYPVLERESGITFHHPVGLLFVRNDHSGIANQRQVIEQLGLPVGVATTDSGRARFPWFEFPGGWTLLHEPGPAGYIDPRLMLRAQLSVASQQGADIRRAVASSLERYENGYRVHCMNDEPVEAERVLLATGPYLDSLLPRPLAATVVPEAIILAEVAPAEAERLAVMPSVIYLLDHAEFNDVYLVPPTRYPDGRLYLKMGGSCRAARPLRHDDEKRAWMSGAGADRYLGAMREILIALLPDVRFEGFSMKPCMITDTAHGLPFIDAVDDGLFVAAGGNGHAAKSADAIGALGAEMAATGRWPDPDLDPAAFTLVTGERVPQAGSRHGN